MLVADLQVEDPFLEESFSQVVAAMCPFGGVLS